MSVPKKIFPASRKQKKVQKEREEQTAIGKGLKESYSGKTKEELQKASEDNTTKIKSIQEKERKKLFDETREKLMNWAKEYQAELENRDATVRNTNKKIFTKAFIENLKSAENVADLQKEFKKFEENIIQDSKIETTKEEDPVLHVLLKKIAALFSSKRALFKKIESKLSLSEKKDGEIREKKIGLLKELQIEKTYIERESTSRRHEEEQRKKENSEKINKNIGEPEKFWENEGKFFFTAQLEPNEKNRGENFERAIGLIKDAFIKAAKKDETLTGEKIKKAFESDEKHVTEEVFSKILSELPQPQENLAKTASNQEQIPKGSAMDILKKGFSKFELGPNFKKQVEEHFTPQPPEERRHSRLSR